MESADKNRFAFIQEEVPVTGIDVLQSSLSNCMH